MSNHGTPVSFPKMSMDIKVLLSQLHDMKLKDGSEEKTMDDILMQMSDTKRKAREAKEANKPPPKYVPPGGWKHQDPMKLSMTKLLENKSLEKQSKMKTVAAFRTREAKWDGSFELESGLKRSMYRTPSFDPTGSKVGLGRAKYTGKGPTWAPVTVDQVIPPPGVETYTESYLTSLVTHITNVIEREERYYEGMTGDTDEKRNNKANVMADIHNLKQVRGRLDPSRPVSPVGGKQR